jgi:serine protease inhibitor
MRKVVLILTLAGMVSMTPQVNEGATAPANPGRAPAMKTDEASIERSAAAASARFGFELFAHLRREPGNVFFSPLSIEMALAMASEGAAGETARQMRAILHLPDGAALDFAPLSRQLSPADSAYDLVIANALWGDRQTNFKHQYLDKLRHQFDAELKQVDFADPTQTSTTINRWVSEVTRNRIKDLIATWAITPQTRLILTDAVYFKGRWKQAFDERLTSDQDFTPLQGPKVSVPFMEKTRKYRYAESALAQVLELSYAGGGLSMLVILPRRPADLDTVESELTLDGLNHWLTLLNSRPVEVHLPRFRLETSCSLDQTLASIGMPDAFDSHRADFSGMDGTRELFIGRVAHKAFVEADEKGTTAAAATGMIMPTATIRRDSEVPVVFRADHPFVFLIRDAHTGAILFMGRMARPTP